MKLYMNNARAHIHAHIHAHTYTHIHTQTHTHIHTHTYTHTDATMNEEFECMNRYNNITNQSIKNEYTNINKNYTLK